MRICNIKPEGPRWPAQISHMSGINRNVYPPRSRPKPSVPQKKKKKFPAAFVANKNTAKQMLAASWQQSNSRRGRMRYTRATHGAAAARKQNLVNFRRVFLSCHGSQRGSRASLSRRCKRAFLTNPRSTRDCCRYLAQFLGKKKKIIFKSVYT